MAITHNAKTRRAARTRGKLHGTAARPRISVFRSNTHMSVQAIDDDARVTVASATSQVMKEKGSKIETAKQVGQAIGALLKEKKIMVGIFDRGSYRYHGRVAAVAEGVREAGIQI